MMDAIVFWGDEAKVTERIQELFSFGASEVLISPIGIGEDQGESVHRTTRLIAELAKNPINQVHRSWTTRMPSHHCRHCHRFCRIWVC